MQKHHAVSLLDCGRQHTVLWITQIETISTWTWLSWVWHCYWHVECIDGPTLIKIRSTDPSRR